MKSYFLLIFISLSWIHNTQAQNESIKISDKSWQKLPTHPRLFANKARFAEIKTQNDEVSKRIKALTLKSADAQLFKKSNLTPPTTGFKMGFMRNIQERIIASAMSYRLTGEKRYANRVREELLGLAAVTDWGENHFLDIGEAALAAGIGYDWIYDELSTTDRDSIAHAIVGNALLPSLKVKEGTNSWVNGNFNWNPVCHAGLTVAALAIAEHEPQLARQIVERGIKNVPYAGEAYSPDGSYPEGPSYWSYGTSFYVLEIEALRTVFGTTCDLEKMKGFLGTADYNLQMVAPTGAEFNYSDYHVENLNEPIMMWFGRETGRFDLIESELSDLNRLQEIRESDKNGKKVVPNRHFPLELIWWQPSLKTKSSKSAPTHWTAKGGLPIGVLRSAWGNPNASFIAIKGGTPNNSHGHMDCGSFILEADSVRWAVDLGTESYDKMRAAKLDLWNYSQNSNRWTTFRCGPDGHNILRFNNARQDISGFGTIEKLPDTEGVMGDVLDLSSLYKSQVEKVTRTVKLLPNKYILIEDAWKTG